MIAVNLSSHKLPSLHRISYPGRQANVAPFPDFSVAIFLAQNRRILCFFRRRTPRFEIDRYTNRHISFGIGEHFCLEASLARLERQVMFRQLAERMEFVELAGPVQRMRSSFVGGIKHMPFRYRIRARS